MLKEEFEELIKREVNENQYKNIETAYEALPEYMDKRSRKRIFMLMLVFSFLLKGAPACEGMRSLYLYNA